jgi:hypothetical protein
METTNDALRELLRVYVQPDGLLDIRVLVAWPGDPKNHIPAMLSEEVAKAITHVLAGSHRATEFLQVNQPSRPH